MKGDSHKRYWIKIHTGLLEAKHREAMGVRVWLFMYLLHNIEWDTGIVEGFTDSAAADDLEMPLSTLRKWRQELQDEGYITCRQGNQCQRIVVHRWRNPHEATSEQLNVPQVDIDEEEYPDMGTPPKMGTPPRSKVGTPTYDPHDSHKDSPADSTPDAPRYAVGDIVAYTRTGDVGEVVEVQPATPTAPAVYLVRYSWQEPRTASETELVRVSPAPADPPAPQGQPFSTAWVDDAPDEDRPDCPVCGEPMAYTHDGHPDIGNQRWARVYECRECGTDFFGADAWPADSPAPDAPGPGDSEATRYGIGDMVYHLRTEDVGEVVCVEEGNLYFVEWVRGVSSNAEEADLISAHPCEYCRGMGCYECRGMGYVPGVSEDDDPPPPAPDPVPGGEPPEGGGAPEAARPDDGADAQTAPAKPKTAHQMMYDAITLAFNWTGDLNDNERGQVNKASKLLRQSKVEPAQVDALYKWCAAQDWPGFGPLAMANHVQDWRNSQQAAVSKPAYSNGMTRDEARAAAAAVAASLNTDDRAARAAFEAALSGSAA